MTITSETRTYKKEILEIKIKILDLERDIENHEIMIKAKKEEICAYMHNIKQLSRIHV